MKSPFSSIGFSPTQREGPRIQRMVKRGMLSQRYPTFKDRLVRKDTYGSSTHSTLERKQTVLSKVRGISNFIRKDTLKVESPADSFRPPPPPPQEDIFQDKETESIESRPGGDGGRSKRTPERKSREPYKKSLTIK